MRKIWIMIPAIIGMAALTVTTGCRGKESPGRVYMPDMAYSRAFETYAAYDTSKFTMDRNEWGSGAQSRIFYNYQPVAGTMARDDVKPYPYQNDTTGYRLSSRVTNPLDTATIDMKEAERIYLVNCAICHGSKLDGNGPLWKDGTGPFPAAPRNLKAPEMIALHDGTMFHSITYGRNTMGSYASQLNPEQRWMVIAYIRQAQGGVSTTTAATTATTTDTTAATPKM